MKATALLLGMILSSPLFAANFNLSYNDDIEVKKVVLDETLLIELYELPGTFLFEGERMIAGKFETLSKKKEKKSFLEGLREKISNSQTISRF